MNRTAILAFAVSLAACLLPAPGEGEEIPWLSDLDAARQQAKESGKPMLIVFR